MVMSSCQWYIGCPNPVAALNGVYVVSVLGCDLGIFLGCIASQALFSGPTGDVMSHLIPFNHSLCI